MDDKTHLHPHFSEMLQRIERVNARMPSVAPNNTLLSHLVKYNAKLMAELMNRELKDTGLSHVSFAALMFLYSTPSAVDRVNPSDLCNYTGETRTNMTRIVDDLVERGLVKREPNPEDRRRVDLMLSDAGVAMVEEILPKLRRRGSAVFETFDEAEKQALTQLLTKLLHALETHL